MPSDAASARQLLAEAVVLCDSGQFELAAEHAGQACTFFRNTPKTDSGDVAEAAFQTGRALIGANKYEAAQPFLAASADAWSALYPKGSVQESGVWLLLGKAYLRLGKYDEAIEATLKALALQAQFLPENQPVHATALQQCGLAHIARATYLEAIPFLEKAVKINSLCFGEKSEKVAVSLDLLAQAYLYDGVYKKGIAAGEKALAIQQQILPRYHPGIFRSYMTIGTYLKDVKKNDDALFYFNNALEIQLALTGESHSNVAYCYSFIGQVYLAKNEPAKALAYFQKEDSIMIKIGDNQHPDYLYTCNDLGKANLALGNYPEAIRWQEKALAVERKASKTDNANIASLMLSLGRAQLANGQYQDAIESFRTDLRILTNLFGAESNPLFKSYAELGNAYQKWYLSTGQDSLLEMSRQYYRLAEARIEKTVREERLAKVQEKILNEAVPYFEKAIGAELLFYQKHQDPSALEKAWQLSEAMHGYLLLSSTQEANARHFAGIPDAELRRDSLLRTAITALEKERQSLIENQGRGLTDSLVLALSIQVSAKKEEAQQLHALFEKKYPDYFRLKYERQNSSLKKTQELLSPQQTLLEYFTGDASIFVFVVQQEGSRVLELSLDFPLNDWVQDFREGISGYHAASADKKKDALYKKTVLQYADAAQKLYQKLLAPIAGFLKPEIILVPGDGLAGLPFEALLSAAPKDLSSFKSYPFLLRNHTVQYAYSATMLHQMSARQHAQTQTGELLAFAPFFEEDTASLAMRLLREDAVRRGLSPLPFSGEEVVRAKTRCGAPSEVFIGKVATKQTFQELAARYKILHLATHGKANHVAGDFSFLAFTSSDANLENGLLSVGELYNLPLNADLVLLSACETGIGEQQRGEGVVSLARAFAFAGAKSIVASLWSVSDKSTMQVMDHFYAGIQSGKPKNIALANAKLEYLEKNPGQKAHPFFWAGFVAVGDMAPIEK